MIKNELRRNKSDLILLVTGHDDDAIKCNSVSMIEQTALAMLLNLDKDIYYTLDNGFIMIQAKEADEETTSILNVTSALINKVILDAESVKTNI